MSDVAFARMQTRLGDHEAAVHQAWEAWDADNKTQRLWQKDASVWTASGEENWLGWLDSVEQHRDTAVTCDKLAQEARAAGFKSACLLGMGGSSLGPEVIARTLGTGADGLPLHVLDSTVPQQVARLASTLDLAHTVFVVASKSGGTTEPNAFKQYFYDRVAQLDTDTPGSHFLAITDPGSSLEKLAGQESFRGLVHGTPSIGGRYSVLSPFGLLPMALLGLDTGDFLRRTQALVDACKPGAASADNPGVGLGVLLGVLARAGRDKVCFFTTPGMASLGAWLEQLIAESSGKHGKGIVPVDGEALLSTGHYGDDRVFVHISLAAERDAVPTQRLQELADAGHPIIEIVVDDVADLGQEFYRWEMATAVACAELGINAFDQPDVEASKVATRRLTAAFEESGQLPDETPLLEDKGVAVFAAAENASRLQGCSDLAAVLAAHVDTLQAGDYFAINAYVDMDEAHASLLQQMRQHVLETRHVATTVGFGPRFLHSTGQLHKGGANNGVFLQLTAGEPQRLPVPQQKYSFGELVRFQAQGDLEVLIERQRRVVRLHLGDDSLTGLRHVQAALLQTTS